MENLNNLENINNETKLIILAEDEDYLLEAEKLADKLNAAATLNCNLAEKYKIILSLGESGLSLTDGRLKSKGDFTKMIPRLRKNNIQSEFLVKAAKIKGVTGSLTVVDATAGLGEDSIILAAAGFNVKLYEYDSIIAALLKDSLNRAKKIPELEEIVSRMEIFEENSIDALPKLKFTPDIVLLDPMFPERQKSALVKKKFQLIHQLERPCENEEELVNAAIKANPRKIIIKRPLKGAFLAGIKPSYSIKGKAIRYDCLVFAG